MDRDWLQDDFDVHGFSAFWDMSAVSRVVFVSLSLSVCVSMFACIATLYLNRLIVFLKINLV